MRSPVAANSEALSNAYGVLKLTLASDSYEWQFIPVAGGTFTDAGSGTCHGPPTGEVTETVLGSSTNPSLYGQPVTFTASVHSTSGTPVDGTVSFIEGTDCENATTSLGAPVPVSSGQATLVTSALDAVGSPHAVTACYDGGKTFVASSATVTQQVSPAPAVVTLSDLSYTYDGTAKAPTVTTSPSGLPVTLSYTLDGVPVASAVSAGSYVVTAVIDAGTNYTGSATATLTIISGTQTIAFGAIATHTMGDPDFAISATSSAGALVSFVSSTDACAVSASTLAGGVSSAMVQLTNVGLGARGCTLTARQPGDAGIAAAADVTQSFEVLAAFDAVTGAADNFLNWDGKKSKIFNAVVLTVRTATGGMLYDATKIDPASVRLAGTKATTGLLIDKRGFRYRFEDVDLDGDLDFVMFFDALLLFNSIDLHTTVNTTLTGAMLAPDGRAIRGVSTIKFK
jgi:hypothetical protein